MNVYNVYYSLGKETHLKAVVKADTVREVLDRVETEKQGAQIYSVYLDERTEVL